MHPNNGHKAIRFHQFDGCYQIYRIWLFGNVPGSKESVCIKVGLLIVDTNLSIADRGFNPRNKSSYELPVLYSIRTPYLSKNHFILQHHVKSECNFCLVCTLL